MKTTIAGRVALATGIAALTAGLLPAAAHAADARGERKTLPVLVEFSDSAFQHPGQVKAGTPDTYFGPGEESLASFLSEVSRGQFTTVPAVPEKVVGPVRLPMAAAGCDHGRINSLTQEALAAKGLVRGEDYESLSIIFPAQKTGCAWAGLGSVPGPYTWINLYGTASGLGVLGHELGHNLGLGHQGRAMCTDGDLVDCETNGTSSKSLMGGGGPAAGFSAPDDPHGMALGRRGGRGHRVGYVHPAPAARRGRGYAGPGHPDGRGPPRRRVPPRGGLLRRGHRGCARLPGARGCLRLLLADRPDRGEQHGRQRRARGRRRRHVPDGQGRQGLRGRRRRRRRQGRDRGRRQRRHPDVRRGRRQGRGATARGSRPGAHRHGEGRG
ncbi:hypothetical protein G3M55_03275 [Streptomyces sp. SID8455]|nr:hypothetical protein [Streptomyces sp. SID8455]